MEPRRRNPLRRYPTAVCISVLHFGLTQSKTRALNSPDGTPCLFGEYHVEPGHLLCCIVDNSATKSDQLEHCGTCDENQHDRSDHE